MGSVVLWAKMRELFSLIILLCRTPSCGISCLLVTWFFMPTFPSLFIHPGKLSEMKSTWSPGPISHSQASLSHELWKVPQGPRGSNTAPSRPPPGLTNTKPSSTWGGNSLGLAQGWSSSYTTGSRLVKYLWWNSAGLIEQSKRAPSLVKTITLEFRRSSFKKKIISMKSICSEIIYNTITSLHKKSSLFVLVVKE